MSIRSPVQKTQTILDISSRKGLNAGDWLQRFCKGWSCKMETWVYLEIRDLPPLGADTCGFTLTAMLLQMTSGLSRSCDCCHDWNWYSAAAHFLSAIGCFCQSQRRLGSSSFYLLSPFSGRTCLSSTQLVREFGKCNIPMAPKNTQKGMERGI